ncbi:MAG TPA: isoleucine--tRNA ligase [Fimbriimonas sp.]|nr:isoleucine--tRNA ligase [Fimbriimonas sp.]
MDFRLNLPDANATIPMKANLPSLEPAIQAIWAQEQIYHKIQAARKGAPSFVLHDGPPYTNSGIHLGTALNKVLKDFVVKSRTMMGFRAPYVPGYDNHGLPIEQTVMKKFQEKKVTPSVVELRRACREHAAHFIDVQSEQFQRLGIFGLWELPYKTMEYGFEAEIIRVFRRLVEGGHVYKGLRPTLWSPTSRTALADTEIVYKDHVSRAIYVRFPLLDDPDKQFREFPNLYTIIWTTTPWTIPANLAVAFHPEFEYAIVKVSNDHYLIAETLVPKVAEALGWPDYSIERTIVGVNLEKARFRHPIFDRPSLAVTADYVTAEDGTGVVHTAPSHGRDDFYTGLKYGLPVPNTVDERGYLTEETGEFAGTYYKECDKAVVDRLGEVGALLKSYDYPHSYPYAERDERPVIFRATEQWFVALDPIRVQMLEEIKKVNWVPKTGYNRIDAMVRNRPDWCISRQRPWGVGIPVFYGLPSRTPVLDPVAIESVAQLVEREGSDAWFEKEPHEILPAGYKHPETGETSFAKETDVLDVWFDSGSTSMAVLEGNVHPEWKEHWPADIYLEGSDQHRGWFNSSLILGVACKGGAPYKTVVTNGFVTDASGDKMSKRTGNVIDPVQASQTHGADIIRYWVASVEWSNDVPCSEALLKQVGESYRNVRNTLRFLLGMLPGYLPGKETQVLPLDEWAVEQTDLLIDDCVRAYEQYEFGEVITSIHNFCRDQLSKFYLDVIKDRMYCEAADSPERVSGQAACYKILVRLLTVLAPILVHTSEETWRKLNEVVGGHEGTIHADTFRSPNKDRLSEIEASDLQEKFAVIVRVRDSVNAAFETFKAGAEIKDSQDAVASISESGETLAVLQSFGSEELSILFKLSWVELREGPSSIQFAKSPYLKCQRSRLRRPDVEIVNVDGEEIPLTARDRRVLGL